VRIARLAFLSPISRNLALVWHEKMVYAMYVIVGHFLPFFDGVGMKKHCLAFLKPLVRLVLSTWNYRTFSQDKGPLFSATAPFSKIQVALPSK